MRGEADLGIEGIEGATEIGRGGFGVVYRARQPAFDRTVAVKVLSQGDLDDAARRRFEREARAMGALSGHPNIVTVHDLGFTSDGHPYLVLEFCENGSLSDVVRRSGPLRWQEAVEHGVAVAGALETAHRGGVLHRDVKPENVLISAYGAAKLGDFGIARVDTSRSVTGSLTGSPAHVAPEQVAGEDASPSSDVYSLASTVYTLICGKAPFTAESDTSILPLLNRIAHQDPPDLRASGVPEPVWRVLEQGLAKRPADRHRSALDFGAALRSAGRSCGAEVAAPSVLGASGGDAPVLPVDPNVTRTGTTPPPPPPASSPTPPGTGAHQPPAASTAPPAPAGQTPPPAQPPPAPASAPRSALTTSRRWPLVAASVVAVVLLGGAAAFALSAGSDEGDDDMEEDRDVALTTTTVDPTETSDEATQATDEGAPTTETAPAGPAASTPDISAALLTTEDLPPGWVPEDSIVADVSEDDYAYCDEFLPAFPDSYQDRSFADPSGTVYVASAAFSFPTVEDALSFVDEVQASTACGSWVDSEDGSQRSVANVDLTTAAEDSRGFTVSLTDPSTGLVLQSDESMLRQGRFVSVVAHVGLSPNDAQFSDDITAEAALELVDAVGDGQ